MKLHRYLSVLIGGGRLVLWRAVLAGLLLGTAVEASLGLVR